MPRVPALNGPPKAELGADKLSVAAAQPYRGAVDSPKNAPENSSMSTDTVPADVQSDLEALCAAVAEGKAVDPALAQRVQERAKKVREEIFRRQGLLNVAVELVREGREE
jgi:hypothetical protein